MPADGRWDLTGCLKCQIHLLIYCNNNNNNNFNMKYWVKFGPKLSGIAGGPYSPGTAV
jgi:hypothetical protein